MPALRTPTIPKRARARRGSHEPAPRARAAADADRHRRAGGPEDRALYRCQCGYTFEADVSASVGCPRCGTGQAW